MLNPDIGVGEEVSFVSGLSQQHVLLEPDKAAGKLGVAQRLDKLARRIVAAKSIAQTPGCTAVRRNAQRDVKSHLPSVPSIAAECTRRDRASPASRRSSALGPGDSDLRFLRPVSSFTDGFGAATWV